MGRRSKLQEIEKEYSHLLGEEWRSIHSWSCYHCVRKYYRLYCNRELRDFTKLDQIYAFTDNAIDTEEGEYVMKSEMWEKASLDTLAKDDIMLFRLWYTPLEGGYTRRHGQAPNHGGVYLGDGFMLHHPYRGQSQITDLLAPGNSFYMETCVGAIRGKST